MTPLWAAQAGPSQANALDCNDADGAVPPGVPDICDCWGDCAQTGARVDNDCDNNTDEDVNTYLWANDADSDGTGGSAFDANTYCGAPAANTAIGDGTQDCNDSSAASFGAFSQLSDAAATPLSLPITAAPPRDASGNLYVNLAAANTEVCDGEDNNCAGGIDDGVLISYYLDSDSDTYGDATISQQACIAPANYVADNTDCNDGNTDIYPNAIEVCDGIDNDCVGGADDTVALGGLASRASWAIAAPVPSPRVRMAT